LEASQARIASREVWARRSASENETAVLRRTESACVRGVATARFHRRREVLGVQAAHSESGVFWTDCLRTTARRGLRGVTLLAADDHEGLRAAARRVFDATRQRCRVPRFRNALAHVSPKSRAAVAAMLKTIFAHESKAGAEIQ
jgi:hypothetical protein